MADSTKSLLLSECCSTIAGLFHPQSKSCLHAKAKTRVADPDPNWIRIQSGQWIRIRV
jgi:hypothetical protein